MILTRSHIEVDRLSDTKFDYLQLLEYIDPIRLPYQDWTNVGMALHHEGYSASDWDKWSALDTARYKPGECHRKWLTFEANKSTLVTGATLVYMAKKGGWTPKLTRNDHELDWDDEITVNTNLVVVDKHWIEKKEIDEPDDSQWNPTQQLILYLKTLFETSENVGYVTETYVNDEGKHLPTRGVYDRTAGELIQLLTKCKGDICSIIGDYKQAAGAWIRFNPIDGKGVKNENVTDYRYALVESDTMDIEQQNAILRAIELPIAVLVHSGKKSLHAIVKIEATDYDEYRKRVNYLYDVCKKNGLNIDNQNRNPSRLSRMPGIIREGKKQFIIDVNIGKSSWNEWQQWIEGVNDDLPDFEGLADCWFDMPDLAPPLIDGILRQGHKMLIAGASKAGKSFALIQLCIAVAEGTSWMGWNCAQGKVMYVNLELDRASCLHRFRDVYEALEIQPKHAANIDVWNLRGKSLPMDKLAPKLIRRALKKNYIAIIIDPIYKVLTGDENSADQMAHFTNQFDKICTELGSSVIYCHHHSKGAQGSKKSMDRASGSGVFARDPDALIDLLELELTEELREADDYDPHRSAWRIEGTLREFPRFAPVHIWFDYPIHRVDESGLLDQLSVDKPVYVRGTEKRMQQARSDRRTKMQKFEDAINNANAGKPPTKKEVANFLNIGIRTVEHYLTEHGGFWIDKNNGHVILRKT